MRTLILGSKGQLGRELLRVFAVDGPAQGVDLPELDISNAVAVARLLDGAAPDLIINAAAYTNVEAAEEDREAAFRANEDGARHVAEAASIRKVPVVYYSTDYVFGGSKTTPYEPQDAISPIGVYAKSKAAGEKATVGANPRHFIIRTAWLYGPGGNNFVEKILRAAGTRPELRVVSDEVGSPTHTEDLAQATRALCKTVAFGVYHAVNEGSCSRFEFAQAILSLAGVKTPVKPCMSSEFPTKAERPLYSVLSNAKLERVCGHRMRPWKAALERYLQRRENS
ncbi:MAG: dTDP-4-dehydrorhamnose reductase [Candidatus Hydrogenedentes bacterium]|nr:dTDP-4-dehydrorhamnose reductase [Candidatus Hydrogenedentota bacterium]